MTKDCYCCLHCGAHRVPEGLRHRCCCGQMEQEGICCRRCGLIAVRTDPDFDQFAENHKTVDDCVAAASAHRVVIRKATVQLGEAMKDVHSDVAILKKQVQRLREQVITLERAQPQKTIRRLSRIRLARRECQTIDAGG